MTKKPYKIKFYKTIKKTIRCNTYLINRMESIIVSVTNGEADFACIIKSSCEYLLDELDILNNEELVRRFEEIKNKSIHNNKKEKGDYDNITVRMPTDLLDRINCIVNKLQGESFSSFVKIACIYALDNIEK